MPQDGQQPKGLPRAEVEALTNKIFTESENGIPIVLVAGWWEKPDGMTDKHYAANAPDPEVLAQLLEQLAQEVRAGSRPEPQGKSS